MYFNYILGNIGFLNQISDFLPYTNNISGCHFIPVFAITSRHLDPTFLLIYTSLKKNQRHLLIVFLYVFSKHILYLYDQDLMPLEAWQQSEYICEQVIARFYHIIIDADSIDL